MVTLFTGYANNIFHLMFNVYIQRSNLAKILICLAETLKIVGSRKVQGACFFKLQEPLAFSGTRVTPSAKWGGGLDC